MSDHLGHEDVRRGIADEPVDPGPGALVIELVGHEIDGEAIGNIRFRPVSDDADGNRGFWLAERYWNQGLMSEAVSAVNDFAFRTLGIESYYACNAATNVASRRVKQKTGAELVGYIELAHHSGQTLAEKWRVTRENWLRRKP